jgi:hypothetical protein
MYRTDRSNTHQAFRDQLASVVRDLKRDHDRMDASNISYDLGYIGSLLYSIEVEVQNTMTWGHEHDRLRKDVQQCKDLVDRLNGGVSV